MIEEWPIETWLAGTMADSSIRQYQHDLRHYVTYCRTQGVDPLRSESLLRWRDAMVSGDRKLAAATINRRLSAMWTIFNAAQEREIIPLAVVEGFKRVEKVSPVALRDRRRKTTRISLTSVQVRALCDCPSTDRPLGLRDRAILHTLATTGVRVSELVRIKLDDVSYVPPNEDEIGGYLVRLAAAKNAGVDDDDLLIVPLEPEAYEWMLKWTESRASLCRSRLRNRGLTQVQRALTEQALDTPYVFTSAQGRAENLLPFPLAETSVWDIVRHYGSQIGVENLAPHHLRRFVGTHLAEINPRLAQRVLRHRRIDTTMRHYVMDRVKAGATRGLY